MSLSSSEIRFIIFRVLVNHLSGRINRLSESLLSQVAKGEVAETGAAQTVDVQLLFLEFGEAVLVVGEGDLILLGSPLQIPLVEEEVASLPMLLAFGNLGRLGSVIELPLNGMVMVMCQVLVEGCGLVASVLRRRWRLLLFLFEHITSLPPLVRGRPVVSPAHLALSFAACSNTPVRIQQTTDEDQRSEVSLDWIMGYLPAA